MSFPRFPVPRGGRTPLRTLAALAVLLAAAQAPAFGQNLVRIEADWSMIVATPNSAKSSPQVGIQHTPYTGCDYYFQFHLNFNQNPSYSAGGLEIEAWQVSTNSLLSQSTAKSGSLNTTAETVTWTDYMDTTGNVLKYGVKNGNSTTWGSFSLGPLTLPGTYTNLNNFNAYYTLANSGALYGGQRLTSLNPTTVRLYY